MMHAIDGKDIAGKIFNGKTAKICPEQKDNDSQSHRYLNCPEQKITYACTYGSKNR